MSWLYLARRSDLQGAPVFICKAFPKTNTVSHCYNLHRFPMAGQGILPSHPFTFLQKKAWVSPTCPVHSPTTRSAMKVSSVSPDRWLTITPQPFSWANLQLQGARNAISSPHSYNHHLHRVRSRHPLLPPSASYALVETKVCSSNGSCDTLLWFISNPFTGEGQGAGLTLGWPL